MAKENRTRIKELETEDLKLKLSAENLLVRGQEIQQQIAQVNTARLKLMGAIEELKR